MKIKTIIEKMRLLWMALKEMDPKKRRKFLLMYSLYFSIVGSFDYLYMPWLAIRFKYLTFFPLAISLFVVCILGLFLYEFFQEDMFLKEKILSWINEDSKIKLLSKLKCKIRGNPRVMFVVIAMWWSPLHAYIFFRKEDSRVWSEVFEKISKGSLYCAIFWSLVIDVFVALWDFGKFLILKYWA